MTRINLRRSTPGSCRKQTPINRRSRTPGTSQALTLGISMSIAFAPRRCESLTLSPLPQMRNCTPQRFADYQHLFASLGCSSVTNAAATATSSRAAGAVDQRVRVVFSPGGACAFLRAYPRSSSRFESSKSDRRRTPLHGRASVPWRARLGVLHSAARAYGALASRAVHVAKTRHIATSYEHGQSISTPANRLERAE
jgi:hypothetical protein